MIAPVRLPKPGRDLVPGPISLTDKGGRHLTTVSVTEWRKLRPVLRCRHGRDACPSCRATRA